MTERVSSEQQTGAKRASRPIRLGGFVITYNRAGILASTLNDIMGQSHPPEAILVVDNSSTDNTAEIVASIGDPRIIYKKLDQNMGPAGAAYTGIQWAREQGFDWVYWGDDDDPPHNEYAFEKLLGVVNDEELNDVGAIGFNGAQWNWSTGQARRLSDEQLQGMIEVAYIAGNQSFLISRQAIENTDPPARELFFGFEELEYCLRIQQQAGMRVVVNGELMLEKRREFGRAGTNWSPDINHIRTGKEPRSPYRQYYSTRNYIYMMRQTFHRPGLARKEVYRALGRCVQAWMRNPAYGARFTWYQLRGVIDGYISRMGKTVSLR